MLPRLLAALAAVLVMGTTAAQAAWITRDVNLRTGPSTVYPAHRILPACTRVDVHAIHGGWLRVASYRGEGWVAAHHVVQSRPVHCRHRGPDDLHRPPAFLPSPFHHPRSRDNWQRDRPDRSPRPPRDDAPEQPFWGP